MVRLFHLAAAAVRRLAGGRAAPHGGEPPAAEGGPSPSWEAFLADYARLRQLLDARSPDTVALLGCLESCWRYMQSLNDQFTYNFVYALPAFTDKFDFVNDLHFRLECSFKGIAPYLLPLQAAC